RQHVGMAVGGAVLVVQLAYGRVADQVQAKRVVARPEMLVDQAPDQLFNRLAVPLRGEAGLDVDLQRVRQGRRSASAAQPGWRSRLALQGEPATGTGCAGGRCRSAG